MQSIHAVFAERIPCVEELLAFGLVVGVEKKSLEELML